MTRRRWLRIGLLAGAGCVGVSCAQGTDATAPSLLPGAGDGAVDAGDAEGDPGLPDAATPVDATSPPDATSSPDATGPVDAHDDLESLDSGTTGDADSGGGVDASDGAVTCAGGKIACGGVCVDPTKDPANCGGCGHTCGTGLCGVTVAADMSAQPANWTFNGAAVWDPAGPSARMTAAKAASVAGTVVYNHALVTDAFNATFQFRMGANGGGRYDGMGFMMETTGATAVGQPSSALGMASLGGYGVEFDVYNNGACGDVSGDQVGIDMLQTCSNGMPTSIFASPDLTGTVDIADAQWHTATVQLAGYSMSVTVDGHAVATNVTLTSFAPGATYFYGFSGGTGGNAGNGGIQTEARNVSITFPTPRCL